MDYQRHYNKLIERAKNRKDPEVTERHHIIPRSIGGNDNFENIVRLTPEEHFVAHQLLLKMYPEYSFELTYALNMMTVPGPRTVRSNKRYGWIRRRYITECKKRTGDKNPSFGKSWYHNPETGEAGKFSSENIPKKWNKGRTKPKTKCKLCNEEKDTPTGNYCEKHRKEIFKNRAIEQGRGRRKRNNTEDKEKFEYAITTSKTWSEAIKKAGFKTEGYSRTRLQRFAQENELTLLKEYNTGS